MQFSEANGPWQSPPEWVEFLVKSGLKFGYPTEGTRRIVIISMPCESPAAGLVALGALCRRLAIDGANDSNSHFQRIDKLAAKSVPEIYLQHCNQAGRFRLEPKDRNGSVWVRKERGCGSRRTRLTRNAILPSNAHEWRFDGEPPVSVSDGLGLQCPHFYKELSGEEFTPVDSNFIKSDSGICLAGRVSGESVSRSIMAQIQYRCHNEGANLASLLAIQNWSPGTVSRVTFFNTRSGQLDRNTGLTRLVVADGDLSFLRVLESPLFRNCDLIGVIHRVVNRDRLEALGVKITELGQWYTSELQVPNGTDRVPRGITMLGLKRKWL
jgi:hypothetical protein